MANITKFISTSKTPEAIQEPLGEQLNNMHMGNIKAPFESRAAYIKDIQDTSNFVLGNLQKNEVDPVYVANAKANTQLFLADNYNKLAAKAAPGGNLPVEAVQSFDQHTLDLINKAPNDATKQNLLTIIPQLRANLLMKSSGDQERINQKGKLQNFQQTTNNLGSLALSNPGFEGQLKSQISSYANTMIKEGFDPQEIEAIQQQAINNLDIISVNRLADTDPKLTLDKLSAGEYNNLGESILSGVKKRAEGTLQGERIAAETDLDDIVSSLESGKDIPDAVQQKIELGKRLGLKKANLAEALVQQKIELNSLSLQELEQRKQDIVKRLLERRNFRND